MTVPYLSKKAWPKIIGVESPSTTRNGCVSEYFSTENCISNEPNVFSVWALAVCKFESEAVVLSFESVGSLFLNSCEITEDEAPLSIRAL